MTDQIDALIAKLTLDEKLTLIGGASFWYTHAIDRVGVPAVKVTDGPNGSRGDGALGTGTPTACIPSGSSLGAMWDVDLVERLGVLLGEEARAKKAHVLLAPTVNLHRSPKGGRNFECFSEDPFLTGKLAAAFVRGVQSQGVATTTKHFVANDSEFERHTIDSQIDERTMRETVLLPFEMVVKEAGAWGVMTAYNRLNGTYCAEHEWLLQTVLRGEWGFDGFVVTDWFAAGSAEGSVAAGCSLEMPGPARFYGESLREAVEAGTIEVGAVDPLVVDLLRLMERTGAFGSEVSPTTPEDTLDRPEDRFLLRSAAAAGSVLLRNDGILPLDSTSFASLAVIGPNAVEARTMGGGSAKVKAYHATSPVEALRSRLTDTHVVFEKGCHIDRSLAALTKPLLDGPALVEFIDGHGHHGDVVATEETDRLEVFASGAPAPGVSADVWSCRITASVVAMVSGVHDVRMIQCGRARVSVDGEVVIDATEGHVERSDAYFGLGSVEYTAAVDLIAGQAATVVVEFDNRDTFMISGVVVGVVARADEDLMARAVAAAEQSDVAVVVVGTNDDWETEGRDRDLWELPGDQPELIRRVAAVNPRTIVVLNVGAPHALDWIDEPAAVLSVGFGGQELSEALVDMLLGELEPGGRAATTVGAHYEQFAAYPNYPGENSTVRYGEGVLCGHRWHDAMHVKPLVPFGFGLGYTTFSMSAPRSVAGAPAGSDITVEVDVANTGGRPGSEVVQIYVEPLDAPVMRPVRELKAFTKVHLEPGASTVVSLELPARAFAYFDPGDGVYGQIAPDDRVPAGTGGSHRTDPGWYVEPGRYRIVAARSSCDPAGDVTLLLSGDAARLSV